MAHDEAGVDKFNVKLLTMSDAADTTPTLSKADVSGALFCSGGKIWIKEYDGSLVEIKD